MALLIYRGQMLIILFNHFSAAVAHSLFFFFPCQLCLVREASRKAIQTSGLFIRKAQEKTKEWMKSFHEILPGFSPCRYSQHPSWSPTSLHDPQPLTEKAEAERSCKTAFKKILSNSELLLSWTMFLSLIIHQHLHEWLLFMPVYRKQLSAGKHKSCVWIPVFNFPVCCFIHNVWGRSVKSSEQCWLHISKHLKSLALRRQLRHHFLKPLQVGYPKKPLITTINLVLIHQVASKNLGFGDQRDHKHRE